MSAYHTFFSATLPPRFLACAAALGMATLSLSALQHVPVAAQARAETVTLPTILVVPDAADRAAAAALNDTVAAAPAIRRDGA